MSAHTASHVVCPLCGKSSSLKSFPAGSGSDLVLQTFQGLGRGNGFAVRDRTSGLGDATLCLAVVPKLLDLLGVFADRGYVSAETTLAALAQVDRATPARGAAGAARVVDHRTKLDAELRAEREARTDAERERKAWATDLAAEREKVEALILLTAGLQHRIDAVDGARQRLVASSREALVALQSLRPLVRDVPLADQPVERLVASLGDVARCVRGLQSAIAGREDSRAAPHGR